MGACGTLAGPSVLTPLTTGRGARRGAPRAATTADSPPKRFWVLPQVGTTALRRIGHIVAHDPLPENPVVGGSIGRNLGGEIEPRVSSS
jgi:hypothetical protein